VVDMSGVPGLPAVAEASAEWSQRGETVA